MSIEYKLDVKLGNSEVEFNLANWCQELTIRIDGGVVTPLPLRLNVIMTRLKVLKFDNFTRGKIVLFILSNANDEMLYNLMRED